MPNASNPFYVEPANPLQALILGEQGYAQGRQRAMEAQQQAARKQAQEAIASGDTRGALAALIGANDPKMAAVLSQHQQGASGVYGTPIYGTDPKTGETVLGAIGKQGQFQRIDTGGVVPTPGVKMLDTGTGYVPIQSRTGQPVQGGAFLPSQAGGAMGVPQPSVGYIPKDVAGEARNKKIGAEQAELMSSKAKNEQSLVQLQSQWKLIDDSINNALGRIDWTKTGLVGSLTSGIPGTPGYDLSKVLETIKANIGFDKLQSMRENSPTGGALGQVSDFENRLLQSVRGAMDQGQSPSQLKFNLQRVQRDLKGLQQEKRRAFERTYSGVPNIASGATGFTGQQQTQPVRVNSPDEARRLPSGTPIILPDGSLGRVP